MIRFPAGQPFPALSRRGLLSGAAGLAAGTLLGTDRAAAQTRLDALTDRYLDELSLRQRVAQLFVFQAWGTDMTPEFLAQLQDTKPGGLIFCAPNIGWPNQITGLVQAIHASNPLLPPYIAIDQEGGDVIRLPGDPAPGAIDLGLLPDDQVREKSRERSDFLAAYGFDVNFAPVADVAYTPASTMYLRSFGSDPKQVADKVMQVVRGAKAKRVMGAAKHFPGHGRTSIDSHYAIPTVDLAYKDWLKTDALPFKSAIAAGVEMVMIGHLEYTRWDNKPTSLSKVPIRILREELGFEGITVTDDLGMGALAALDPLWVVDRAVAAGVDVLLYTMPPLPWDDLVNHLTKRVRAGDVSKDKIDASARRVIRQKIQHFHLHGKGLD